MSNITRRVAKRFLKDQKGYRLQVKESWWWNREVEKVSKEKQTNLEPGKKIK